ncbi:MAG TPA: hypothetical protein VGF91_13580 [Solirubrobacteraceae bacterium]
MSAPVLPVPSLGGELTGQELAFAVWHSLEARGTVSMHREQLPPFAVVGMAGWLVGATQPAEVRAEQLAVPVDVRLVVDAETVTGRDEDLLAGHLVSLALVHLTVPSYAAAGVAPASVPADREQDTAADVAVEEDGAASMRAAGRRAVEQGAAVAVERPRLPELTGDPVEDVRALYALTYGQLASLLGVTERQMHRLRGEPVTGERRERLDALTALGLILIGGLGPDGARLWLDSGDPPGSELLRQGRYAELRRRAEGLRDSVAT